MRAPMPEPGALVTGGASGIGAALVRRLAATGHRVAVVDVDAGAGARIADEVGGEFLQADLAEPGTAMTSVEAAASTLGRLDVLCLNAGVSGGTGFGPGFDEARYRRVMAVDLDAVVSGFQAGLRHLSAGAGGILVTASLAGLLPSHDLFYAAAKHAVVGLVRSWGLAGGPVRAVAVCPGFVRTQTLRQHLGALTAAGIAVAEPDHVASAALTALATGPSGSVWEIQAGQPAIPVALPDIAFPQTRAHPTES
jgi:NAD(P)-dependent dehydrogenase (short-subunit alcohol dehydrogenase family)